MRKNGAEWAFDSSEVLGDNDEPRIGYVALYSDVEHEVAVVTSGYRVTITYNLYFDDSSYHLPAPLSSVSAMNTFRDELSTLLIDPEFLPDGGYLGFGLDYAYSLSSCGSNLGNMKHRLKGVDADLMHVFKELSLVTSFWSLTKHEGDVFACEGRIPDCDHGPGFLRDHGPFSDWIINNENARVLESDADDEELQVNIRINWVKDTAKERVQEQSFINYGNESYTDCVYQNIFLVVKVGKPGSRKIPESPGPMSDEDDSSDEDEYGEQMDGNWLEVGQGAVGE